MISKLGLAVCFVFVACLCLTLTATPAEAQQYPSGLQTIKCESSDGRRKDCSANIGGEVRLSRQLSNAACVEGRNWGWSRNGVWVDNGCRAEFQYNSFTNSRDGNRGGYDRNRGGYGDMDTIKCESHNNSTRRTQCRANIDGNVRLSRQISDAQCVQGRSWGYNRTHVWVSNGCRAEFEFNDRNRNNRNSRDRGRDGRGSGSGSLMTATCESNNNDYKECRLDRDIRELTVSRQLSNASCNQGNSWGLKNDQRTIWVNHGCRAVFQFRST